MFSKSRRRSKVDPVRVPEVEAKSNSSSSPVQSPGAVHNKTDAQVAYGLGFGRPGRIRTRRSPGQLRSAQKEFSNKAKSFRKIKR
jgi:hypothetical protein